MGNRGKSRKGMCKNLATEWIVGEAVSQGKQGKDGEGEVGAARETGACVRNFDK